jgi:hypothetical protein
MLSSTHIKITRAYWRKKPSEARDKHLHQMWSKPRGPRLKQDQASSENTLQIPPEDDCPFRWRGPGMWHQHQCLPLSGHCPLYESRRVWYFTNYVFNHFHHTLLSPLIQFSWRSLLVLFSVNTMNKIYLAFRVKILVSRVRKPLP